MEVASFSFGNRDKFWAGSPVIEITSKIELNTRNVIEFTSVSQQSQQALTQCGSLTEGPAEIILSVSEIK